MHWILEETSYQNDSNVAQRLAYTLAERGIPFTFFKYIPFGGTDYTFLKDIPTPALFFGTWNALTDIRKRVKEEDIPQPFAWCDLEKFKCSYYYPRLKPFIFQTDYQFITLGHLKSWHIESEAFFFRPDDNEKSFVGQVIKREMWSTWAKNLIEYSEHITEDLPIVIAKAKRIEAEWRLLIVNEKVITGSQYKECEALDIREGYPLECINVAERAAKLWSPHPVYIMDIGLAEGQYKIVEIGPFNYAGLYKCDLNKVVESINNVVKCECSRY